MIGRRTRAGYASLNGRSQILNHHNDGSEIENVPDVCSTPSSSTASSRQHIPSAPSPVIYTVYGYKYSTIRTYLYHTISVICLGIPYLISHSSLSFYVSFKLKKCDLDECDFVLVTNNKGQVTIETVLAIRPTDDTIDYYLDVLREISRENASTNEIRMFEFEHVRYIFNNRIEQFVRMRQYDEISTTNQLIHTNLNGLCDKERDTLMQLYGRNTIEIAVKSYWELFQTEILNPFYLFQIFSVTLWCFDDYYWYAGCVFILSAISIYCSLRETRAQSITLHNVIESLKADCIGIKNESNEIEVIASDLLVPGDIIAIPVDGGVMACDAVLITGSCIVNESMLTGESVPVTKTPPTLTDAPFEWMTQKRHILYAGTTVLQTRYYGSEHVLARVLRTGFNTSKGELVKSILFPRPIEFRFYEDSVRFVSCLFCVSALGIVYTVQLYRERGADLQTIIVRALDIITIVVPPALPLAMTAGQVYSQARLKAKNIFCISPQRINVCGKLKLVCFDKTGTLTDDGLTMDGCRACKNGEFLTQGTQPPHAFDEKSKIVQNMATCHSLTTIHGTLNGDPLDIEMFRSIKWEYIEPGREHTRFDNLDPAIVRPIKSYRMTPTTSPTSDGEINEVPYSIGIIKQHQFSSEAQCMSVIVRVLGENHMKVYAKGAPEKIHSLCQSKTIPGDFFDVLYRYTSRGYRVIALAHKKLPKKIKWMDAERMKRTEIETALIFDGFLILLNCLKPETTHVIDELHAAKLRTVMITGDNIMTALSVAKDCRMIKPNEEVYIVKCDEKDVDGFNSDRPKLRIKLSRDIGAIDDSNAANHDSCHSFDNSQCTLLNMPADRYHLALDGTTWKAIQLHYPQFIPHIVARGTIFARFRPEQKSQIVICLKQYDYIVAMCGDGANDCGALKAAHIGVSLSKAEASVAAPFTSSEENITCIKHLTLEGRCALVTSFGLFKYMIMYSFIQFIGILILYTHSSILGNFQFLYVDLIITAGLAFSMGRQGPAEKLVPQRPSSSLLSLANVFPLLMQVLLCAGIQLMAVIYLFHQPWYSNDIDTVQPVADDDERILCWENTVLFLVSCYQYLILGVVYSKGLPYRQPVYTNGLLIFIVGILTTFTTLLVLRPMSFLSDIFEIEPFADGHEIFRLTILAFPLIHLLLSYGIELLIAERKWYKRFIHFIVRKKVPRNRFKRIELNLKANSISDLQQEFKC